MATYKMTPEIRKKISNTLKRKGIKPPSRKGIPMTEEHKRLLMQAFNPGRLKGERNPNWKGNKIGISGLHEWVKKNLIKPQVCSNCNQPKPLDLANISQQYKRNLSDWEWLCRKCHMTKDGRIIKNFIKIREYHLKKSKTGHIGIYLYKNKYRVIFNGRHIGMFNNITDAINAKFTCEILTEGGE